MKADRNAIEQAYAFFHQKLKVYEHSTSEKEMDHIEDCVAVFKEIVNDVADFIGLKLTLRLSKRKPRRVFGLGLF